MFDLGSYELMLAVLIALVVIGPKDLPALLRFVGRWVGKARGIAAQFRLGIDDMVRQSELKDMERKWAEENARIMREFPDNPVAADVNGSSDRPAKTGDGGTGDSGSGGPQNSAKTDAKGAGE